MHPGEGDLEIEVKFHVSHTELMRQRIRDLGAESQGRCFERNIRFDRRDRLLRDRGCLLRLRQDRKTTLTFKSRPADQDDQFKIFRELEVDVGDFEAMRSILRIIGFEREQIYEKWRETFTLGSLQFCMDTMPFGNFLEIEGFPPEIVRYAGRLGLD